MNNITQLLSESLKKDKFVIATAKAFEKEMLLLREEITRHVDFILINELPEWLVDYLAYERHVDYYEDLSYEEKKNVVRESLKVHRLKGTKQALLEVFNLLNMDGRIPEWFEYNGNPYYFKVFLDVSEKGISEQAILLLERLINTYKNNRSWVESFDVYLTSRKNKAYVATSVLTGEILTLFPYSISNLTIKGTVKSGTAEASIDFTTIYPKGG